MNKEDIIVLKPKGEEWTEEDLIALGYQSKTIMQHPGVLKMWKGIGDTATVRYNYELKNGSGIVVLPNYVFWSLFKSYDKEMKYRFGRKLLLEGKYLFINEGYYKEFEQGVTAITEAEKEYTRKIEEAIAADKTCQAIERDLLMIERNINRGVYGIYKGEELVYIGSTNRSFEERWEEHLRNEKFNNTYEMRSLYTYKEIVEDLGTVWLADRELRIIEFMLIRQYKPLMNVEGVSRTFKIDRDILKDPFHFELAQGRRAFEDDKN